MIRAGDLVFTRAVTRAPPLDDSRPWYESAKCEPMVVWRRCKLRGTSSLHGCDLVCLTKGGLFWFYTHEVFKYDD